MATKKELEAMLAAMQAKLGVTQTELPKPAAPTTVAAATAAVLDTAAKTAISAALSDAWTNVTSTGNFVTRVAEVANQYAKGLPISEADRESMALSALKSDWQDSTKKSRKSDAHTIMQAYVGLPAACTLYRSRNRGNCTYRDALDVARGLIKHGGDQEKAVTHALPEAKPELTKEQAVIEKGKAARERLEKALKSFCTQFPEHGVTVLTFAQSVGCSVEIKVKS